MLSTPGYQLITDRMGHGYSGTQRATGAGFGVWRMYVLNNELSLLE
jgi:hypothetical protein